MLNFISNQESVNQTHKETVRLTEIKSNAASVGEKMGQHEHIYTLPVGECLGVMTLQNNLALSCKVDCS